MPACDWMVFLTQWSEEILSSVFAKDLPPDVRTSGWLGYQGATDAQIAQAEGRLNAKLPSSYKAFLAVSNGFRLPGMFVPRLFSVDEIEWFRVKDPLTITVWQEAALPGSSVSDDDYFVYGEKQDCCKLRPEYLETALQVSERERAGSAVYLLNPQVVADDGEWEAWYFAHWLPGANRYRSFLDLMQAEHQDFLSLKGNEERRLQPDDDPQMLVTKLPGLIKALQEKVEEWVGVQEHRQAVGDPVNAHQIEGTIEGLQIEGTIEGLRFAEVRVQEIQKGSRDPHEVRKQLGALVDELEHKCQEGVQTRPKALVGMAKLMVQLLSGNLQASLDFLQVSAVAQGYRQAVGIIRRFLNDQ